MTALIIICGLILFFALLLSFNLRIEIKYYSEEFSLEVRYLFLKLYPLKDKPEKRNKDKKRKKKFDNYEEETISIDTENADTETVKEDSDTVSELSDEDKKLLGAGDTKGKKEKKKLSDKIEWISQKIDLIKLIWNSTEKGLRKIFKCIHFDGLVIDFVISDEDAYDAAMKYGKISAVTYNAISVIRLLFPISVKTVDVACDFDKKKSVYDGEVTVKMRVSTLINAGIRVLWGVLKNWESITGKPLVKKSKKDKPTSNAVNA